MIVANVVNDRPIALGSLMDADFVPCIVNQLPLGRTSGTLLEPQADQGEQHFGGSICQQDLLNTW